jgi:hypothetical protein
MKKLLVLMFVALPLWAQNTAEDIVIPTVCTATIDSIRTINGSATITTQSLVGGGRFASVTKGAAVWGRGIPFGTTVVDTSSGNDSVLVLSKPCTYTDTTGTTILGRAILNFGYYAAESYQNGDWVGLPFELPNAPGKVIAAVVVTDSCDVLDSLDVLLFNDPVFDTTSIRDTVAASVGRKGMKAIIGILHLTSMTDLGNTRVIVETNQGDVFPISRDKVYGRLICRSTDGMAFKSIHPMVLRFKYTY